jgi:hypothetical protein
VAWLCCRDPSGTMLAFNDMMKKTIQVGAAALA